MRIFWTGWQVAYREKKQGSILNDTKTPFKTIKNRWRYWVADPFVFEYDGESYIFAEVYDRLKIKGSLGYSKYSNGNFDKWQIAIKEPFHLSFPNIFTHKGEVYIIPESGECNELYVYKAVGFPEKWEKVKVLLKGGNYADSVILHTEKQSLLFTYEIRENGENRLVAFDMGDDGKLKPYYEKAVSTDISSARPGGNFFVHGADIVRVSQDCKNGYGNGLVFSRVANDTLERYQEEIIKRLYPNDISIEKFKGELLGMHTYNANHQFEVIDLKIIDRNLISLFFRIKNKLSSK